MKKIKIEYKLFLLFGVAFIGMIFLAHKALSVSEENITSTRTLFENSTTIQSLQEHYIEPLNLLREMSLSLVMSPNESFAAPSNKSSSPLSPSWMNAFSPLIQRVKLHGRSICASSTKPAFMSRRALRRERLSMPTPQNALVTMSS